MAIGNSIIEIHFTSKRKPSQKEGSKEEMEIALGLKRKTVEILNSVKIKT